MTQKIFRIFKNIYIKLTENLSANKSCWWGEYSWNLEVIDTSKTDEIDRLPRWILQDVAIALVKPIGQILILLIKPFFVSIGIHSMQGWAATVKHEVTRKTNSKWLKHMGNLQVKAIY